MSNSDAPVPEESLEVAIADQKEFFEEMIARNCCPKCQSMGRLGLAMIEPWSRTIIALRDEGVAQNDIMRGFGSLVGELAFQIDADHSPAARADLYVLSETRWGELKRQLDNGAPSAVITDGPKATIQ